MGWEGEGLHAVTSLDLLVESTNFDFYSIKIQAEIPEIEKGGNKQWGDDGH